MKKRSNKPRPIGTLMWAVRWRSHANTTDPVHVGAWMLFSSKPKIGRYGCSYLDRDDISQAERMRVVLRAP